MRRSSYGYGGYDGQPQPDTNMNDHRSHSEHVTEFAGKPCHAGGGVVQHHTAVHKESFKEVGGDCYDPRRGHHHQQQAHRHHGYNYGGPHGHGGARRFEYQTYEICYEKEEGGGGCA